MSLQRRFKKLPEKRMFTPRESSVYTGLSIDKVYELLKNRVIPYVVQPHSTGSGARARFLIDRRDWDDWIERRKISAVG
jgi:hypothetical protein